MKTKLSSFILMYLSFFIYSISSVCSKLASGHEVASFQYIVFISGTIGILGVYAVLWQQVLKRTELSVAMANKPVVLVFSCLWACLFFHEQLTLRVVIGMILIMTGTIVMGLSDGGAEQ